MPSTRTYGRCDVCKRSELEIDDGGYLFCSVCGARETHAGEFVPSRMVEKDYRSLARGIEACGRCGGRNTRRESDIHLVCFDCMALEDRPVPQSWLPEGAHCAIGMDRGQPRPGPVHVESQLPFATLLGMLSSDGGEKT